MGAIGGMMGFAGGAGGSGFAKPQAADITNPVTQGQISGAYTGVQNSMEAQKQLLDALKAQNGIQNQSDVYGQLQGIAAGKGPNPAQAMLAQSTGANVANQAALMAGQRGASANVGLMARQAAQQGGALQQQAAGQAATMQANQSLNAINSAGGIAGAQVSNQMGQTNQNTASQQQEQQALLNAQAAYNNAQVGSQSNLNSNNAALAGTMIQQQGENYRGIAKAGAQAAGGGGGGAEGGMVKDFPQMPVQHNGPRSRIAQRMAGGGEAALIPAIQDTPAAQAKAPLQSSDGGGKSKEKDPAKLTENATSTEAASGAGSAAMVAAHGGKVPAILSPGEKYLAPNEARAVAAGKASPAQVGKIVPGTPKYKGNNYANDVVPAKLDEGGVVIPNSVMQSKDPVRGAANFVQSVLAKKKVKK